MVNSFESDNLGEWLSWLETLHPRTIELGLDRVRQVAEKLDLFTQLMKRQPTIITVAGTNGKGTCVAALQALLLEANQSVGSYTSPHLLRYNERVVINGEEVNDEELVAAFRQIESVRGETSLSYFEYGTLAAFLLLLQAGVRYWLLEVGLGGRLDAVNLLDADIGIVTAIDLDHQDWLGNTREQIAIEKAGIYRRGKPAICVDSNPPQSLIDRANQQHANLLLCGEAINWNQEGEHWNWSGINREGKKAEIQVLPLPNLPIPSLSAALQAFALLDIHLSNQQIRNVIANADLPGRCQTIEVNRRRIIFDVAHNPAAATYLAHKLQGNAAIHGKTRAIFAVLADKDIPGIVMPMTTVVQDWHLAPMPAVPRAASLQKLGEEFTKLALPNTSHASVGQAISAVLSASQVGDRIVIFGSFYTVAEGLQWLQVQESSGD